MQEHKPETYYLRFSECLQKLEREIPDDLLGPCYKWIDTNHDNAWSKAISRLERAVLMAQEHAISEHEFKLEQSRYFETMLEFVKQFKKYKNIDETQTFLKSLGN